MQRSMQNEILVPESRNRALARREELVKILNSTSPKDDTVVVKRELISTLWALLGNLDSMLGKLDEEANRLIDQINDPLK